MPYDSAWFSRYDTMVAEAADLPDVQGAHKAAKEKMAAIQAEADQAIAARTKADQFIKEQEDRIQLVNTHWFFGTTALQPQLWLRGGTTGKIARAKAKLDIAQSERPILVRAEAEYIDEKLPAQKEEVQQIAASIELKKSLQRETQEMRAAAVAANPSNEMTRLRTHMTTLETTISETSAGADSLRSVGALCGDANELYVKAAKAAEEACAAARDAEPVVAPVAAQQADGTPPPTDPAEHAEAKERLRQAAVVVLNADVEALHATIADTASGADGLKAAHTQCARASTCYAAALKLTLEAAEAFKEGEGIMHPPGQEPLYGAPPPLAKWPCPAGCGNAVTGQCVRRCRRRRRLDAAAASPPPRRRHRAAAALQPLPDTLP